MCVRILSHRPTTTEYACLGGRLCFQEQHGKSDLPSFPPEENRVEENRTVFPSWVLEFRLPNSSRFAEFRIFLKNFESFKSVEFRNLNASRTTVPGLRGQREPVKRKVQVIHTKRVLLPLPL